MCYISVVFLRHSVYGITWTWLLITYIQFVSEKSVNGQHFQSCGHEYSGMLFVIRLLFLCTAMELACLVSRPSQQAVASSYVLTPRWNWWSNKWSRKSFVDVPYLSQPTCLLLGSPNLLILPNVLWKCVRCVLFCALGMHLVYELWVKDQGQLPATIEGPDNMLYWLKFCEIAVQLYE